MKRRDGSKSGLKMIELIKVREAMKIIEEQELNKNELTE